MLYRLVTEQQKHDPEFQCVVISLSTVGKIGEMLQEKGITVHALGMKGLGHIFNIFFSLSRLKCLLSQYRPQIVQTWMVHADLIGGLAARWAGGALVIWGVRTSDYAVESRSTRIVRWLCATLSGWLPHRIVCAAQASRIRHEAIGYCPERMVVIPNGFDIPALHAQKGMGRAIRAQLNIDDEQTIVGCLGRYHPAKDHANFIQAATIIAAKFSHCRFLMVGRHVNQENTELTRLIESTGFADQFFLLGERSDPAACLDAMDIFVLSSKTEGFPNALGEAMAMGIPCVTTDVGDASLLLGDTDFVVPTQDPVALAAAVAKLLEMPIEQRCAIGIKGYERIAREFSMTVAVQKFSNLYQEMSRTN